LSGAAGLFTRESFAAIRDRLKPGGLSCQWVQAYGLSEESLLMVIATYRDVFPNTLVFRSGLADIILIGSVEPIDTDAFRIDARLSKIQSLKNRLDSFGIHDTLSFLLTTYVMGAEQLAEMTAGYEMINTDDRPLLEFVAPVDLHKTPYDVMGERYMENFDDNPAVFGVGTENFGSATWHSMGNFFAFQMKDPARAEKMYLNALKADPGMEAAMMALASLYKSMNKPLMAISYYTRVRNIRPNDAQIATNIIRLYVQQNLYDVALIEIDALMEKAPGSLAVKKLRGDVLHLNGDMKAALEQYRSIEREMQSGDPRLASVYMAIAYVAEDMKDGKLATEYLKKTVSATPSNLEALVKLANWLMKSGEYSAAVGHLDAALKIAPDSLEALHLKKRALRLMNARP
ncbi:MAG TPA: tetratricopeptide repeat protein, partial [bacterium]|nr:tetratricopeptide repeat protein [bacterium]